MKRSLVFVVLSLLLLVSPVLAISGTIVNPIAVIDFELPSSGVGVLHRDIILRNTNEIDVKVTLDAQSDFKGITTFSSNDIIIEAGGEKKVPFEVRFTQPGTYVGNIDAFFRNADDESDVPAALRARYTVLVSGEGSDVVDNSNSESSTDGGDEAPRTFENNSESSEGTVGFTIGGDAVKDGPLDPDTPTNWFAISFIALIAVAVVLGVVFALKR